MKNLENNEMIEISKTDLAALLECAYILKEVAKSRDVEDLYNIIEDGSIDSESFDDTGEYTDSEIELMETYTDTYVTKWYSLLETYRNKL